MDAISFQRRIPDTKIIKKISATMPQQNIRQWYCGLMDYGALVLTDIPNPNRRSAHYHRQARFEGSSRQARGRILAEVVRSRGVAPDELRTRIGRDPVLGPYARPRKFHGVIRGLLRDGLLNQNRRRLIAPGAV